MASRSESNFVVLTTNRSGSTWLMSLLNSLPNVTGQGELFLPRPRSKERRWDSDFACPRYIETKAKGLAIRPFSVFSYLDTLYSAPGTVGFKLMYTQLALYPEILPYLMWNRIRVVHLVRRNHLDIILSYAVKARMGQAHLLEGQAAPDDMRVELDTKGLINKLEWLERKHNVARKLLAWSGLQHIEVTYEDLVRDQRNFQQLWQFLLLPPDGLSMNSSLVKIRKGGHREVIRNYDQVRELLSQSRFATLLE
jgi:LPS sulfotransferase NodH